ncbi:MAG: hypothetical protein GY808_19050 [Gammaproteobacteria bacterium]|nr:hypothetical protein [Gammaproteobacteria bacterium]
MKKIAFIIVLLLVEMCVVQTGLLPSTLAQESSEKKPVSTSSQPGVKSSGTTAILGMNVTGNKESPRSLTIVPWRTPQMNGESPEITPYWQPTLSLLDPESYRRDVNLFLKHRQQNANQ